MGSGDIPPRVGLQLHSTPAERLKASSLTSLNIRPFLSVHRALTHFAWVCWEMGWHMCKVPGECMRSASASRSPHGEAGGMEAA